MKSKKFLALLTLCALAVPTGFHVAAEDSLITGVTVQVSADGTNELQNKSSVKEQTDGDGCKEYLVNVKDDTAAYAKISVDCVEDATVELKSEPSTGDSLTKGTYFAIAGNRDIKIEATKTVDSTPETEVQKVKFNYVPQTKDHANTAVAVVNQEFSLDLTELFADKDDDAMSFSYALNGGEEQTVEGNVFTYTPTEIKTDTVTFYATDAGTDADSSVSPATFRMSITVQNDAILSSLSFGYPGVDTVSLSPAFDSKTENYVLNIPDGITYVVPVYAAGEAEKCYVGENNNVNSIPTNQSSFSMTYKEGALQKTYTFTLNHLPKYVGETTIHAIQGESVTVSLADLFDDSDEDALTVTASAVTDATEAEGIWTFTPQEGNTATEVTFTANDGKGTTIQKVAIDTIVMETTMLKSLSIEVSDEEEGTYQTVPFTTEFLPNQYAYVLETNASMGYGKITLEKNAETTDVSIVLKRTSASDTALQADKPFEILRRENVTLAITLTDKSGGTETSKTYTVVCNRPPEFDSSFPSEIKDIATGQELSLQYDELIYDYETDRVPSLAAYDAATGKDIGTLTKDGDDNRFWNYTPTTDGTVNVKFVITDSVGSKTEKIVPITAKTDTEPPVWGNDKIAVKVASNTSVKVSWPRPSDNDVDINGTGTVANIKSYTIYYQRQGSSKKGSVTVAAVKDMERKATVTDLTPGYYYDFYMTAEDRSGNVSKPSPTTRCTMPSVSSQNSSNSTNSGGTTGGATTYVPITTPIATPTATPSATGTFADMAEYAWAQTAVTELAKAGVINGIGDNLFAPGNEVTRADFLVMLFRALNVDYAFFDNFADVPQDSYYYKTIGMAKAMGVATGMGDNLFYPNRSITREEMITLTYRILTQLGKLSVQAGGETFGDIEQVSAYALQAVQSLNAHGVITGDDNGNVNPRSNTRRCEAAVMIYRIWSK